MRDLVDYEHGISAVDAGYLRPVHNAIHLIVEGGRAAVIDTGVGSSAPRVLAALAAKGLRPANVDYVILTHVHLDHAGGAGVLLEQLPQARLTVHPRGVRHVVDPQRLIASTLAVYGEARFRAVYGEVRPVDPARIVETPDDAVLSLNGRELRFLETPGHALHHVCVHDTQSGHVFTGDTFGLCYCELDRDGRRFVVPTSSPTQFDPVAAHRSVDRIAALRPGAVYVTHYSRADDVPRLADDMHRLLDAYVALARAAGPADDGRHGRLKDGMTRLLLEESARQRWPIAREGLLELFAGDIELNAQGLALWLDRQAAG